MNIISKVSLTEGAESGATVCISVSMLEAGEIGL